MYRLLYWPLLLLLNIFSILPLKVHYFFSHIIHFILYRVVRYRLDTVLINISRAFPEMKYKEVIKTADDFYRFLSEVIVEAIWAHTRSSERVGKLIDFTNPEIFNEIYGDGRNIMVEVAHKGNWEIFSASPSMKIFGFNLESSSDLYVVYKRPKGILSAKLIERIRASHKSCVMVEAKNIVRCMLKSKNDGGVYYFLADQYAPKGTNFEVSFLNQQTRMITGPEELSRKMKMPVFYLDVERENRKNICTLYLISADASKEEPGFVSREYARLLEEGIRRNKATWLWSHRRWK